MNTSINVAPDVSFADSRFYVRLPNNVSLSFPISGTWRLEQASRDQLLHIEVDEDGIHWPDIDEDLSFAGLLRGDWGQHVKKKPTMARGFNEDQK